VRGSGPLVRFACSSVRKCGKGFGYRPSPPSSSREAFAATMWGSDAVASRPHVEPAADSHAPFHFTRNDSRRHPEEPLKRRREDRVECTSSSRFPRRILRMLLGRTENERAARNGKDRISPFRTTESKTACPERQRMGPLETTGTAQPRLFGSRTVLSEKSENTFAGDR